MLRDSIIIVTFLIHTLATYLLYVCKYVIFRVFHNRQIFSRFHFQLFGCIAVICTSHQVVIFTVITLSCLAYIFIAHSTSRAISKRDGPIKFVN